MNSADSTTAVMAVLAACREAGVAQDQLLRFAADLTASEQTHLAQQILNTNLLEASRLWRSREPEALGLKSLSLRATPPAHVIPADFCQREPARGAQACKAGWQILAEGRVGIILVAGGEGTRLGFPHPKGMFPIAPVSGKTLYQWLAEQVVALTRKTGTPIPYYVMTSHVTHAETSEFFAAQDYFGLNPADVYFFQQDTMPAVDCATGQALLAERDRLCLSPDGHGGLLAALERNNLFDDMRERGIEHLFYHQVDNPLVRVCDPVFLGCHLQHAAQVSTKFVRKEEPAEKVGLLVEIDGRPHIVEYSDVPPELMGECVTGEGGTSHLKYCCGNTAVHIFERTFLEESLAAGGPQFHLVPKNVPYLDAGGTLIEPPSPNAFKYEKFIFDILPGARRSLAVEVVREAEFVPLKNRTGPFSPDDVRQAMMRVFTGWMRAAGLTEADHLPVEIGPLVALDAEEFAQRLAALDVPGALPVGTLFAPGARTL